MLSWLTVTELNERVTVNFSKVAAALSFMCFFMCIVACPLRSQEASSPVYKCLEADKANEAKELLENSKFFISFCSACNPNEASVRRINLTAPVELIESDCGMKIKASGKIVRGVKPPVFGGYCTEMLKVTSPSEELDVAYSNELNLASVYVWDKENKNFTSVAELLGLDVENLCVRHLTITR